MQSERFWGDMFDYGAAQAARGGQQDKGGEHGDSDGNGNGTSSSTVWPGVWVPPMVEAGWKGTNLAAYHRIASRHTAPQCNMQQTQLCQIISCRIIKQSPWCSCSG
jgi:hypothetical protein